MLVQIFVPNHIDQYLVSRWQPPSPFTWCLAVLIAVPMAAQQGAAPPVYRVGGDVKAPVLESSQQPEFTDQARLARLQGTVRVSLVVGDDGRPRDLHVVKPLGLGLDENAVATVSLWRFRPGTKSGQPVAVAVTVETSFHLLLDPRDWRVVSAAFSVPPNAAAPVLAKALYPLAKGAAGFAGAQVGFDIDQQGVPSNIHVLRSSNPKFDHAVTSLIHAWRFRAATQGGVPVPAKATLDLTRGDRP